VIVPSENQPLDAALAWLELVDAGDADTSWHAAADGFRENRDLAEWTRTLSELRAPLGACRSRRVTGAKRAVRHSADGAPAGEYLTLHFAARYANQWNVAESVTSVRMDDDAWRIVSYVVW
jgi:hypothetical protein